MFHNAAHQYYIRTGQGRHPHILLSTEQAASFFPVGSNLHDVISAYMSVRVCVNNMST